MLYAVAGVWAIIGAVAILPVKVSGAGPYLARGQVAQDHHAAHHILEVLLIIANVGTAVVLFPILKWQNEGLALGYVSARLVNAPSSPSASSASLRS